MLIVEEEGGASLGLREASLVLRILQVFLNE